MSPTDLEYDSTPQWSEDRGHWWDGQQWIPAQEAKAKANALAAVSPDARPAYLPPADSPSRRSFVQSFLRRQLIIGAVVLAVLLGVLGVAELSGGGTTLTPTQQVTKALASAASAEHAHLVAKKTFTGDFIELSADGYKGEKGVALTIMRADRRSYCLKGLKGAVALYISADAETASPAVTPVPCT